MRKTELYLITILLVSFICFAVLIYYSLMQTTAKMPPAASAGSEIWQKYGCMECHSLLSSGGYAAVDLTKIMSTHTKEELLSFFENPPPLPPHKKRMHVELTEKEAKAMIAFLRYVNNIDTRKWPPEPILNDKRSSSVED
ncbi:MAG: cytochrome c [Firmicutes bacterium]|nr:cytochrome c [Bacillota bacterium]